MAFNIKNRVPLAAALALSAALFLALPAGRFTRPLNALTEDAYTLLFARERPDPRDPPSDVVIIEIDRATVKAYGWPIQRPVYVRLLDTLRRLGHPWVLSYLHFQNTEAGRPSPADEALAAAIAGYESYVGSGLRVATAGEELSDQDRAVVKSRALLGRDPDEAGDLALDLSEGPVFVRAQKRFGIGPRFSSVAPIRCAPLYVDDVARSGHVVLPTAMLWAAALGARRSLELDDGLIWDNPDELTDRHLRVAEKHCLAYPGVTTAWQLKARGVERYSLAAVLAGDARPVLAGKIVILGSDEMQRFQTPGALGVDGSDDGVVPEHWLVARFLDDLLTESSVRRPGQAPDAQAAAMPAVYLGALALLALLIPRRRLVVAAAIVPALLLAGGLGRLCFFRVLAFDASFFAVATAALFAALAVRLIGRRRQGIRLAAALDNFRYWAAKCGSISDLETALSNSCAGALEGAEARLVGYDFVLHGLDTDDLGSSRVDAVVLAEAARRLRENLSQTMSVESAQLRLASSGSPWRATRQATFSARLRFGTSPCGEVEIVAPGMDYAEAAVADTMNLIANEVCVHWERIELVLLKRFVDLDQAHLKFELELGSAVQRLTLPAELDGEVDGLKFHTVYHPHGAMSGDWVQIHRPPEGPGTALFAVGDVVGKGASAALTTSVIAATWRQLSARKLPLDEVHGFVQDLSDAIRALFRGKQYSTLSLAAVAEDRIFVAAFGAPAWVKFNAVTNRVERIRTRSGNPLGMDDAISGLDLVEVPLGPNDVLFAYTDGVLDGSDAFRRLASLVELVKLTAGDAVFAELEDCARAVANPGDHCDDFTMMMMRRVG